MQPSDLVEGAQYVISVDVEKDGEDHPQLDPGDLVILVNGKPDSDGEVYVTARAARDGAAIGAWVKTEYLLTEEEAQAYMEEHCECEEEDAEDEGEWHAFTPHPQFPDLPAYETLPLGYALGLLAFFSGAQRAMMGPTRPF